MSHKYDERSKLLQQGQRQDSRSKCLRTLPYDPSSCQPSSATGPINQGLEGASRQHRADTDVSITSFGGVSMFGTEASPRDAQELLDNLDRATNLIRRHLQEQPQGGDHVPVSRPLIPRWVTSYLLVITFIWQALSVGFLEGIDIVKTSNSTEEDLRLALHPSLFPSLLQPLPGNLMGGIRRDGDWARMWIQPRSASNNSNIVMTVFQAVHLLLVFFVSYKLVKKVLHRTASGSLLAQSYLSTVLLFAGLYTLLFRFNKSAFKYVFDPHLPENKKIPTLLFLRMLYFSVSTATLCGTSEVEPLVWYANVVVSAQMLMSFVYFASILSLGMIPRRKPKQDSYPGKSLTQRLRDWAFRNKT